MNIESIKASLTTHLATIGAKKGTMKARNAEHSFLCGIESFMKSQDEAATLPPYIVICAMSGRSILD